MLYVEIKCMCGQTHQVSIHTLRIACGCGQIHDTVGKEIKKERSPRSVEFLSMFRCETDRGIGDTVERLITKIGGRPLKRLKALLESLSINCGCSNRRDWLNTNYPYQKSM